MFGRSLKNSLTTPPFGSRLDFAHAFSQNLIARWIFNAPDGVVIPELKYGPFRLTAIPEAGMHFYPGPSGVSYGVDNTNNALIRVADDPLIVNMCNGNPFTFAIVLYRPTHSPDTGLLSKNNGNVSAGFAYYTANNGGQDSLTFKTINATTNLTAQSSSIPLQDGRVHHIVVSGDGGTVAANIKFYADGVLIGHSGDVNGNGVTASDAGHDLTIGANANYAQTNSNVVFNDVSLYYGQMSDDQVKEMASQPYANVITPRIRTYFLPSLPASSSGAATMVNNPIWM